MEINTTLLQTDAAIKVNKPLSDASMVYSQITANGIISILLYALLMFRTQKKLFSMVLQFISRAEKKKKISLKNRQCAVQIIFLYLHSYIFSFFLINNYPYNQSRRTVLLNLLPEQLHLKCSSRKVCTVGSAVQLPLHIHSEQIRYLAVFFRGQNQRYQRKCRYGLLLH